MLGNCNTCKYTKIVPTNWKDDTEWRCENRESQKYNKQIGCHYSCQKWKKKDENV